MREHHYFVYIVTNRPRGVLYTGITNDIARRTQEHRSGAGSRFAAKYNCRHLVWVEEYSDVAAAIQREKRVKKWNRAWKLNLIEAINPDWRDLGVMGL